MIVQENEKTLPGKFNVGERVALETQIERWRELSKAENKWLL